MIISPGRKYIFVHIPKTGGTSLTLALEDRAKADDILIGDTPKARRRRQRLKGVETTGRVWKHSRLSDVIGLVREEELAAYFVFTIVRNPWDRMVSYYHWLREQSFDHPAVHSARAMDFSAFVADPSVRAPIRNSPARSYVTAPDGTERCDLFVRLEALRDDIAPLERHLGFALPTLEKHNASQRNADYRYYYSDATAALVAEDCAEDIARFGYTF